MHDAVSQGVALSAYCNARSLSTGRVLAGKQVSHVALLSLFVMFSILWQILVTVVVSFDLVANFNYVLH